MDNWIILGIQTTVSTVAYALIFFWYVQPRIAKLPFETAVTPMLLVHLFRFAGFTLLVVGQTDPSVARSTLEAIAYGDMLATISALVAVLALRARSSFAVPLIWLFTIIGFADLANVGRLALDADLFNHYVGVMWLVAIAFFPVVIISHLYIVYRLLNKGSDDLEMRTATG
ncbi:MAG: hypothetical protein RLP44_25170 [Aggregatilineales bacterium]